MAGADGGELEIPDHSPAKGAEAGLLGVLGAELEGAAAAHQVLAGHEEDRRGGIEADACDHKVRGRQRQSRNKR